MNTPTELQKGFDDLRAVLGDLPNLIRTAEMLLPEDDLEEIRAVLRAAYRYSIDANAIAQVIEDEVPASAKFQVA